MRQTGRSILGAPRCRMSGPDGEITMHRVSLMCILRLILQYIACIRVTRENLCLPRNAFRELIIIASFSDDWVGGHVRIIYHDLFKLEPFI